MTLPTSIVARPKVDLPHHRIHESRYFAVTTTAAGLPAGVSKDYIIKTPPPFISIAHTIIIVTPFPGAKFELFEGAIVSANGIPLPSFNQDRASPEAATGFAFEDPKVVSTGVKIWEELIGSTTTGGTGGPNQRDEDEFLFIPLTIYLLRTTPFVGGTSLSVQMRAYRQPTMTGI